MSQPRLEAEREQSRLALLELLRACMPALWLALHMHTKERQDESHDKC